MRKGSFQFAAGRENEVLELEAGRHDAGRERVLPAQRSRRLPVAGGHDGVGEVATADSGPSRSAVCAPSGETTPRRT